MSKKQMSSAKKVGFFGTCLETFKFVAKKVGEGAKATGKEANALSGDSTSKKAGSGLATGSVIYGVVTGDYVGAALGTLGGLGLRFQDILDMNPKDLADKVAAKVKDSVSATINHRAVAKYIDPLRIKELQELLLDIQIKENTGTVLSPAERHLKNLVTDLELT